MFRERPLILIADDESKIRRVVAANLERSGFDVCSADDGRRALEILRLRGYMWVKNSPLSPQILG